MKPTKKEYEFAKIRLEELIVIMDEKGLNSTQEKEFFEIGTIIEKYEETHFPIGYPSLGELIALRIDEKKYLIRSSESVKRILKRFKRC
jgi:hypothetical protein